jgi:hypothetical protein
VRDWDSLGEEIERRLHEFRTGQYNDELSISAATAATIAINAMSLHEESGMQPTKPSLYDRFMNSGPVRKVKQNLDENPAAVLLGAAACITATAKLIDVVASVPSKRAYAKSTNTRLKGK